ncbi:hypothetical protein QEH59_14190 [Coraliomargarita sp. SDUM461004]|uniref:Glycoside hydrolase family 5 domain-containing protein n=2 Tax=Thalassobacterium sedimentorum TaxID=3041258 RepID=A0ABU1ALA3_9BACT|nr:hypothetical protein [Coraliomargarita sp. SDUM461004]
MLVGVCATLRRWDDPAIPAMIAKSGISWIRSDYYWKAFEREKGIYQLPDIYSKWIDRAHAVGLNQVAIFNGSNALYAPDIYDPDAYAQAAAAFAKATAGKVQVIEIMNEPANFGFTKHYGGSWNGYDERLEQQQDWVEQYLILLNKAAKAIKEVNPNVKVIGLGSVSPVNIRQIRMGVAPEVDGIVDHPYSFRFPAEVIPFNDSPEIQRRDGIVVADKAGSFASLIDNYRQVSDEFDGPPELWLTEWGWPTYHEAEPGKFMYPPVTARTQAKYTVRRLYECLGLGVDATFIYAFRDNRENPYHAESNFGLVRPNLEPKPVLKVVERFIVDTEGYRPLLEDAAVAVTVFPKANRPDEYPIVWDGAKLQALGKVLVYKFSVSDGSTAIALWSATRASEELAHMMADVEIEMPTSVETITVQDSMTGEERALRFEKHGGRIMLSNLSLPDYPIILNLQSQ